SAGYTALTRRICATKWSSPTGRSTLPSRRTPSLQQRRPAPSPSPSPIRIRNSHRATRPRPRASHPKATEEVHIMKKIFVVFLSLSIVALFSVLAYAWSHGNRYGGSSSHSYGSSSHTNAWGGSSSHSYGEGTSHTNMYGGSATHYEGGGWSKTGAYGGTAYGDAHYGGAYYGGGAYAGYHPPAV